jgi:hypothetical protein
MLPPDAKLVLFSVRKFVEAEELPQYMMSMTPGECWKVRATPCALLKEPADNDWIINQLGDVARIPLVPYRTKDADLTHMIGDAMTIYHSLAVELPRATASCIVLGHPVEPLYADSVVGGEIAKYRMWIGFAAKIS